MAVIFIAALRNGSEWNSFGAYLYNCHTAMLANKKKNAKIVTKGIKKKKGAKTAVCILITIQKRKSVEILTSGKSYKLPTTKK